MRQEKKNSAIKHLNRIAKRNSTRDSYKGRTVSNASAIKRINREY